MTKQRTNTLCRAVYPLSVHIPNYNARRPKPLIASGPLSSLRFKNRPILVKKVMLIRIKRGVNEMNNPLPRWIINTQQIKGLLISFFSPRQGERRVQPSPMSAIRHQINTAITKEQTFSFSAPRSAGFASNCV